MRRAAALGALVLVAAGCGGGGDHAVPASGQDIARAAAKTAKTGSMEADFSLSGPGVHGTGSGVFDTDRHRSGQLTMSVKSGLQSVDVDSVVSGNVLYIRSSAFARQLSGDKQWLKVDLGELAKQPGVNLGGLLDAAPTPIHALAYLAGANKVQVIGSEKVEGRDTTRYRVVVDVPRAAKKATGAERTTLQALLAGGGAKKLPLDVWVDPSGYIRKVSYVESQGAQKGPRVTMALHDFGHRVSITAPPADSVVDLMAPRGG
jgi:hypothetical protein